MDVSNSTKLAKNRVTNHSFLPKYGMLPYHFTFVNASSLHICKQMVLIKK